MKEVLLCPPTHFDIVYQINPWMDITKPVDRAKSLQEYSGLKQTYQNLGVTIHEIPQKESLPDMIYSANYGHPIQYDEAEQKKIGKKGLFIVTNYKHDERKEEAELAKYYFAGAGFELAELPKDIIWEGQGDLLKAGDLYVLGHGKRSDKRAKGPIADFLGIHEKDILDLELSTDHFYHIDTALGPLEDPQKRTVVINPQAFDDKNLAKIRKNFDAIIETNDQDNSVLGCNLVNVGKNIVVAKGISEELKDKLAEKGYQTIEVPMTESLKGGGAVKCNTLEYY